jgi:hypothetical protein
MMKRNLKKNDIFTIGNSSTLYVVVDTAFDGGGTGHGWHDTYPDGHRIVARKLLANKTLGTVKEFYQTGCFNKMHLPGEITLAGRAKIKLTVTDFTWVR